MEYKLLLVLVLATLGASRPLTPRGQAKTYNPAKPCNEVKCQLPKCRCANTSIPGGLSAKNTPQIVTINFDAALRVEDYEKYYSKVFTADRTNPNGCPIGVTFFASHNFTNYALVEDVYYSHGYEIGDNSVTRRLPENWWTKATVEQLKEEIVGQADILKYWGNVPNVYGYRAPYLASSENELQALYESNFTYDTSMPTPIFYWPFTLDYKSPLCNPPGVCPNNSYPGLWEIPNIDYSQESGGVCDTLDTCVVPESEDAWFNFLMDNFKNHYNGNRAPYGIYAESSWFFKGDYTDKAMMRFLDEMQGMKDVYIVTQYQLIEWVRTPTPVDKLKDFKPWQCPTRPKPRCSYEHPKCNLYYADYDRLFDSCTAPCPPHWPHYGDPYGNSTTRG